MMVPQWDITHAYFQQMTLVTLFLSTMNYHYILVDLLRQFRPKSYCSLSFFQLCLDFHSEGEFNDHEIYLRIFITKM